eukprot:scaffold87245_cov15-Prasinocladus_malaysianus.AAC.1
MAYEFYGTRFEGLGQRKVLPWVPRPPEKHGATRNTNGFCLSMCTQSAGKLLWLCWVSLATGLG